MCVHFTVFEKRLFYYVRKIISSDIVEPVSVIKPEKKFSSLCAIDGKRIKTNVRVL